MHMNFKLAVHGHRTRRCIAHGAMENRIKEQQLGLFSDRPLAQRLRTNQLRRCFGSFAHGLLEAIWYSGLRGSQPFML